MSLVLNEVRLIQNQALGAYLLHEFVAGYSPSKQEPKGIPLPLLFLVLPLVLHEPTAREIRSTQSRSGLRLFEHKFEKAKDQLLGFQARALAMRALTLNSMRIAFACNLFILNRENANVWLAREKQHKPASDNVADLGKAAKRLGTWFASVSVSEISGILRIDL